MNHKQLKSRFIAQLENTYPLDEIEAFYYRLTEAYLGQNRLKIALEPTKEILKEQVQQFQKALERLKNHEPIQYILGRTVFMNMEFKVSPHVLIPRPETEDLVRWVLEETMKNETKQIQVLDIGTGSGCIAISLAKHLEKSQVSALDMSKSALQMAAENASQNKVALSPILSDVLSMTHLPVTYDIIVSNPPYVRQLEKQDMERNVLDHEPAMALYVTDSDPLVFYRKIAHLATHSLKENGAVYLECNQYLTKETEQLFIAENFKTELKKDIFGNERMLKAWLIK